MHPEEFKSLIARGGLTRRHFHRLLASVGIAAVTAGSRTATADEAQLQVFTWANYNLPEQFAPFTAKHKQAPSFSILLENDQARAKLRGGYRPDIVVPTENYVPFFMKDGLLEPIDVSRLSHWPELLEPMRQSKESMGPNGEHYHLPWVWGMNGVVFR